MLASCLSPATAGAILLSASATRSHPAVPSPWRRVPAFPAVPVPAPPTEAILTATGRDALHELGILSALAPPAPRPATVKAATPMGPAAPSPAQTRERTPARPLAAAQPRARPAGPVEPSSDAVERLFREPAPKPAPPRSVTVFDWGGGLSVLSSGRDGCRWPSGDPRSPGEFSFCGRPGVPGKSYCAEHCAKAYMPHRSAGRPVPRVA